MDGLKGPKEVSWEQAHLKQAPRPPGGLGWGGGVTANSPRAGMEIPLLLRPGAHSSSKRQSPNARSLLSSKSRFA